MKRTLAAVVAALFAAVALVACAPQQAAPVRVLVIGDQLSSTETGPGWSRGLAAEAPEGTRVLVTVDAVAGSGYLSASPAAVSDRVAAATAGGARFDVIVLALGAQDVGIDVPEQVRTASIASAVAAARSAVDTVVILPPLAVDPTREWTESILSAAAEGGARLAAPASLTTAGDRLSPESDTAVAVAVADAIWG